MAELEEYQDGEKESEGSRSRVTVASAASQNINHDYDNTMAALKESEYSLPEFNSSYDEQITQLYNKIVNRQAFTYEAANDPLYGQYQQQYTRLGKLAMKDSMGQAAALTGGYGSSYAQSVGQQEYDEYLQKLSDIIPELYEDAYQRYKDEGSALESEYDRLTDLKESEYDEYRDMVSDIKYQQGMIADKEQNDIDRMDTNYDRLVTLITKTGYVPSDQELSDSGMTQEQAAAYLKQYGGGGSSSVSSYSYYSGSSSGSTTGTTGATGTTGTTKAQRKLAANKTGNGNIT